MASEADGTTPTENSPSEKTNTSEQIEEQSPTDSPTATTGSENTDTPEDGEKNSIGAFNSTGGSGDPIRVVGASVKGSSHDQPEDENQDAYEIRRLADNICVIAVADGLGSASAGGRGARIATEAAAEAAVGQLKELCLGSEADERSETEMGELAELAVRKARKALEDDANGRKIPVGHLATTLIVLLLVNGHLAVGHIGDGAVVAQMCGDLLLVSRPGETEYVNQVVPLTSDTWETSWRVNQNQMPDAIAAFTDGLRRAGLRQGQDGVEPFPGFFDPVFSYLQSAEHISEARSDLEELLRSEKLSEHSSDDKTLVVALRNGGE